MDKIAAFILTYNEEDRIGKAIQALHGFDEIVVYDKSSQDRTREIAEKSGAKVLQIDYSDVRLSVSARKRVKEYMDNSVESEWVFFLSASDIVHCDLCDEIKKVINDFPSVEAIDIPIYKYSMGYQGKHSFIGDLRYERNVIRKCFYPVEWDVMIHEIGYNDLKGIKLVPSNTQVAVYHLTHPSLNIVMDRHWRYAVQYVKDSKKHGRNRERIMRYAIHECIRLVYRYFRRAIYKSKDVGKAQLMMLIMYNCMIYLNAFFDEDTEQSIKQKYNDIWEMCNGKQ